MRRPLGDTVKLELSLTWKVVWLIVVLVFSTGVGLFTWAYALADKVVLKSDDHTDIKLKNYVSYQDWLLKVEFKERIDSAWRQEMRDRMTRVEDKVNNLLAQRR